MVAETTERERAAEDRVAFMRGCILRLEEMVLSLRPAGAYRQFYLDDEHYLKYYLEEYFFRTWHTKYLFEWYGAGGLIDCPGIQLC